MTNFSIPSRLYKYQPYNIQTLDNLKNRQLWFSKPNRFNDPFDCHINYDLELLTESDWNRIYVNMKELWIGENDEHKKDIKEKYFRNNVHNNEFIDQVKKLAMEVINDEIEKRFWQSGIACFSEIVNDVLMWSHYANGHRGFCLEFDTNFMPFSKALPVKYSELLPNLAEKDLEDEILIELATTKSKGWSYEKEWRIFFDKGDQEYIYDFNGLTGVVFGCAMPKIHKEVISLILYGSPTRLYEMEKSATKFEVGFYEIKYKPFDYTKENRDNSQKRTKNEKNIVD